MGFRTSIHHKLQFLDTPPGVGESFDSVVLGTTKTTAKTTVHTSVLTTEKKFETNPRIRELVIFFLLHR